MDGDSYHGDRPDSVPYMDRILPWGETCRAAESRLHRAGYRMAMRQRARLIKGGATQAGNPIDANEATFLALSEFPPELYKITEGEVPSVSEKDAEFVRLCHAGLNMTLPQQCSIDKLIAWVSANLHRDVPDMDRAPSCDAINLMIDARTNEKVRARFWEICLTKRMSPGDRKGGKASVFAEDAEPEGVGDLDELNRRLWGE